MAAKCNVHFRCCRLPAFSFIYPNLMICYIDSLLADDIRSVRFLNIFIRVFFVFFIAPLFFRSFSPLYTSYLAYSCNFVAFVNIWMQTLCAAHRLLFRDLIYMQCSKFACRIPLREKNIISAVKQKTLSLNCCYVRTTTTTTEKKFFLLFFCTIDSRRALRMTAKFVHNSTFHIFLSATV